MKLIPPSEDQLRKIKQEINLTEEQHKKDTQTLKDWLLSQPHLPHDIEDSILAIFIVGCKNSLERSKQTLDKYLTNRTSCPDFYSNRDPADPFSRKQAKLLQFFTLPGMTPEGYRISVYRFVSPDVSTDDFTLQMNAVHLLSTYDVRFQEDPYWAGDILVIDCKNFMLRQVQALMSISTLKKYIHCALESLPVRYKKIIFINLSSVIEPLLNIVKKLMKQKMVQRMITTSEDHRFLYKHVPKELLPNEFGGQAGHMEDLNDAWQLKVESYRDWFIKDMGRKVDETKRPEGSKNFKDKFGGIEGSFKTLSID